MPLGLMPEMSYEEKETVLDAGDSVLFYSDGLVETHDPQRHQMFGFPRLRALVAGHAVARFIINDEGAWMLKRPQDYPRTEIAELAEFTNSCGFT